MPSGDTSKGSQDGGAAQEESTGPLQHEARRDSSAAHDSQAPAESTETSGNGNGGHDTADAPPADVHPASTEITESGHPNQSNKHSKRYPPAYPIACTYGS